MKVAAPRAVADLLESAMPQLRSRLTEARILGAWTSMVGPDVARRARPVALAGSVLHVVVDNSPWLQELTLRSGELTRAVHARFADVTALRFTLGTLPRETDTPGPASTRPSPLTDADRQDIEAAVAVIPDPTLAAAARRLMMQARRYSPRGSSR